MMRRRLPRRGLSLVTLGLALLIIASAMAIVMARSSTTDSPLQLAGPVNRQPVTTAKLLIDAEGLIEVRRADLKAIGWDTIDLSRLRVIYHDQVQPVWIADDSLRFYASISPTRYMTESVYWLKPDAGAALTITQTPIGPTPAPGRGDHYTATTRVEENRLYAPQVQTGDHWFWAQLPAPQSKTFSITLTSLAGGTARARIEVWSNTSAAQSPDHHLRVAINDRAAADDKWDGAGWHTIDFEIPDGFLKEGNNSVRVDAPGDTGVVAETSFVDWIEVRYARQLVAENDRLIFESAGGAQPLIGFSGPIDVFDVTQPDRVSRGTLDPPTTIFNGTAGHRYVAVGPQGYRSAQVVPAMLEPDLRAVDRPVDYMAIGPSELLEPLQPLLDWRQTQGLKVTAVPVAAVYDQFGDGRIDPEAIRSFLKVARPRYVLLVGDASYDTLGYTAPRQANGLPTFLIQTVFGGETASDVGFALLDDDQPPAMAVGRVPARAASQVRAFVEKTLAYEQSAPGGDWRRRVLAVADGQEPSFKQDAQGFLEPFNTNYQTVLVNPPANTPNANRQILASMNDGDLIVAYFGHGSVTQWGKDDLFTVKDSPALKNGNRLPLIVNMTCLTGLFTHPKVESLAEALLWKSDGGAVAVLAPTSLTLASDQSYLSTAFVQAYLADPSARLGDWVLQAWRAVPQDEPGSQDVLRTFLLLGDPALRLAR